MQAHIIVDLGFGDAGKGLLTDFLVRQLDAGLVVRFNGGAQAGHNVVTPDGRHHTFSQFGSGKFLPHVKTYLSRHVVIHPTALLIEGEILEANGVPDPFSRLRISDQALVITPFHQASNRIREMARAEDRHGSCGVGVGETVEDAISSPEDRIQARDMKDRLLLRRKLTAIRRRKRSQMAVLCQAIPLSPALAHEFEIFERDEVLEAWIEAVARVGDFGLVTSDAVLGDWLSEAEHAVFEGAQGVLLDEEAGFHPHTTWSRCTTANAEELIRELAPGAKVTRIGILRTHVVRHGPGPLPTETRDLASAVTEHNRSNEWQGAVRYGWFDAVLARYALAATDGVDTLAVTHLDILPRLESWKYCTGYQGFGSSDVQPDSSAQPDGPLTTLRPPPPYSLDQRTEFTRALSAVTPLLEDCAADEKPVIAKIEALTGQRVGIVSRGPCADDVQILDFLPS